MAPSPFLTALALALAFLSLLLYNLSKPDSKPSPGTPNSPWTGTFDTRTLAALAFALSSLLAYFLSHPSSKPPPGTRNVPGPSGVPLIGNLPQIPPKHSWLRFHDWSKTYGPLYKLNLAGRNHFIISTEKIANDLLRERGTMYSSREQLPAAVKLLSDHLRPLFWPYGDTFRQGRKLMHQLCMPAAATTYEPTQTLESTRLVADLIREPGEYEHWFMRYSSSLIFRLGFGKRMRDRDDPLLARLFRELHHVERVASPGAYLVDTFPILMKLPEWCAPFKRELRGLHAEELDIMRGLLADVKSDMEKGDAVDCWEKTYLQHADAYNLTRDQGAYVVGTLFEAGAGTTAAAMMSFLLAMVLHPSELTTLQRELDSVVPPTRLPDFSDLPRLPRVRAVAKETLRWRPVSAGGIPHMSTRDDVYNLNGTAYHIPAGSILHANQWAIHRDASLYPSPDSFLPYRWLNPEYPTYREPLSQHPNLQNFSAFGFGRRICPGQHIAERSLYILIARVAWACDVRRREGVEVPEYDYCEGFNVQPHRFNFELRARCEGKREVVERAVREAEVRDPLMVRKK